MIGVVGTRHRRRWKGSQEIEEERVTGKNGKGDRGRAKKEGANAKRKGEGVKGLDAFTHSLTIFPSSCPFLRVFRAGQGLAGLVSANLRSEADRQSIPTVYSYYGQTQIGQLLFTEVLSHLVVDFVGHMVLSN